MNPNKPPSELRAALQALRPYFVRAGWFSLIASLLVLAPSAYMLEVYGRVVNSRSHMTLWMLTLLILGVYVLMELLEWARSEVMRAASVELDERMRGRIFHAIFDANLKRIPGGTQQPLNDFKQLREFLYSPVLLGLMESPVSLVMLVLLFLISPVLGWTSIAFACVITLVGWFMFDQKLDLPALLGIGLIAGGGHRPLLQPDAKHFFAGDAVQRHQREGEAEGEQHHADHLPHPQLADARHA